MSFFKSGWKAFALGASIPFTIFGTGILFPTPWGALGALTVACGWVGLLVWFIHNSDSSPNDGW